MDVDTDFEKGIREISPAGFTRFSIKATDTPQNQAIHDGFKEFCKIESNDDYTQGLKRLLEHYQTFNMFEMMMERIVALEAEVDQLKNKPKEEESEAF